MGGKETQLLHAGNEKNLLWMYQDVSSMLDRQPAKKGYQSLRSTTQFDLQPEQATDHPAWSLCTLSVC